MSLVLLVSILNLSLFWPRTEQKQSAMKGPEKKGFSRPGKTVARKAPK